MNIFIGCSSNNNIDNIYIDKSIELVSNISHYNLIVGGISGLMGKLLEIFSNSTVFCVKDYYDDIGDYYVRENYKTVNERKNAIIDRADVFLFLPGGIGTMDELFSILEAKRAKQHNKRIIIYNINHYYDYLIDLLDNIYKENFSDVSNKDLYVITDNLEYCLKYINSGDGNG